MLTLAVHQVGSVSDAGELTLVECAVRPVQESFVWPVGAEILGISDGVAAACWVGAHEEQRRLDQVADPRVGNPAHAVRPSRTGGNLVTGERLSTDSDTRGQNRATHDLDGQLWWCPAQMAGHAGPSRREDLLTKTM